MTPDDARAALATVGLTPNTVVSVGNGEASWTFELDRTLIAQLPRNEVVAASHARARRLLPELARSVSFAVPQPDAVGEWQGLPFHVYEKPSGAALTEDRLGDVAPMLCELHSFPVDRARELLGDAGTVEEWRTRYQILWRDIAARVLPLLAEPLARQVEHEYGMFLPDVQFEAVLVHRDLGVEHVLMARSRRSSTSRTLPSAIPRSTSSGSSMHSV